MEFRYIDDISFLTKYLLYKLPEINPNKPKKHQLPNNGNPV